MIGNNGNSYGVWDGKCFLHHVDHHIPNHFESLGRQLHSNWASMMSNKNTVLVRHLDTPNPNMLICWLNYLIRNITHWLQSIFWDSFAVSQLHVGIQKTLALPNNLVDVHPTLVRACSVVAWLICPQLGFLFNWTQAKSQDS